MRLIANFVGKCTGLRKQVKFDQFPLKGKMVAGSTRFRPYRAFPRNGLFVFPARAGMNRCLPALAIKWLGVPRTYGKTYSL
jgi:hypothetical protein